MQMGKKKFENDYFLINAWCEVYIAPLVYCDIQPPFGIIHN